MKLHLFSALLLVAGSTVFVVGAFFPVSRVYVLQTAEEKLEIMQGQSRMWNTHLGMMGAGAAIAAVGMAALPAGAVVSAAAPAVVAAGTVVAGTLLWERHLQMRVRAPEGFASGQNPHWHFVVYTVLMQIGLLLLALALFRSGAATWVWLTPAAGTAITVLALVAFQDVPPFAHYVWLLAVGVGLLRMTPPVA